MLTHRSSPGLDAALLFFKTLWHAIFSFFLVPRCKLRAEHTIVRPGLVVGFHAEIRGKSPLVNDHGKRKVSNWLSYRVGNYVLIGATDHEVHGIPTKPMGYYDRSPCRTLISIPTKQAAGIRVPWSHSPQLSLSVSRSIDLTQKPFSRAASRASRFQSFKTVHS